MWCHAHQQNQGEGWPGAAAGGLAGHHPIGEQLFTFVSLLLVFYFSLCVIFPSIIYFFFFLRERWLWSWLWWWGVAGEAGSWIHTACCLRQGRWEHHSLRGPVTLKDRQLCFVLPIVNFIPYGVRMTFNFFEMKICANMVSNSHIQCDIYFYIRSKYERILMYWSGHFHLII